MSETGIVAALRSGDMRRALELLLDSYQDEVYSYCARLVGTSNAMRVYHRVLSIAIHDLATLGSTKSLRAWLYEIARNAVTHHHRHDRRTYLRALDPDYVPVELDESFSLEDEQLAHSLASLDSSSREILQLSLWHGLRLNEIAQITERPLSEVRHLAARGLTLLSASSRECDPS